MYENNKNTYDICNRFTFKRPGVAWKFAVEKAKTMERKIKYCYIRNFRGIFVKERQKIYFMVYESVFCESRSIISQTK